MVCSHLNGNHPIKSCHWFCFFLYYIPVEKNKGHLTTFKEIMQRHQCACVNKYKAVFEKKMTDRFEINIYKLLLLASSYALSYVIFSF